MTALELERRLDDVSAQLAAGCQALVDMTSTADSWCHPIRKAAALLEGLNLSDRSQIRGKEVEKRLQEIRMNSAAASKLLESAAGLHFGRILSRASVDCGYLADGKAVSAGGSCFRIDA
jgi:hypothetical protein